MKFKKLTLLVVFIFFVVFNSNGQINTLRSDKMVEIIIDKDANSFLNANNIRTFRILVETIPCGCVRPREVPKVRVGDPADIQNYNKQRLNNYTVYVKKNLIIPENVIEIKLGRIGHNKELYPIGIKYFNGMGSYCEIPE